MLRVALCLCLVACGDDGGSAAVDAPPSDAAARETIMESKSLVASEIVEATLTGGPGDRAVLTMSAQQPQLDWNLHGHANGSTQVVKEELGVMTTVFVFTPIAQADWFLLLRNASTNPLVIDVKIELYGDITWNGWE